jgi:hypothetical protein
MFTQLLAATQLYDLSVTSSANNVNIRSLVDALGYLGGEANIRVTVDAGVILGSTSLGVGGLATGTFPTGVVIQIINNGRLQGRGGTGGFGGLRFAPGSPGGTGGWALEVDHDVYLTNIDGVIWGGGGGGGGGGGTSLLGFGGGGGGGGGGGVVGGTGGGSDVVNPAADGANGTTDAGGVGGNIGPLGGGAGGTGGGPGLNGLPGAPKGVIPGGAGGVPGAYVAGTAGVFWRGGEQNTRGSNSAAFSFLRAKILGDVTFTMTANATMLATIA